MNLCTHRSAPPIEVHFHHVTAKARATQPPTTHILLSTTPDPPALGSSQGGGRSPERALLTGADLHEHQKALVLGDDVYLAGADPHIAIENMVAGASEEGHRIAFSAPSPSMQLPAADPEPLSGRGASAGLPPLP